MPPGPDAHKQEGFTGDVKAEGSRGYSDHDMEEFKIQRAVTRAKSKLTTLNSGRANVTTWVIWRSPVGQRPGGKSDSKKLVHVQGLPLPGAKVVHPNKRKNSGKKCQQACMFEQGALN